MALHLRTAPIKQMHVIHNAPVHCLAPAPTYVLKSQQFLHYYNKVAMYVKKHSHTCI